MAVRILSIRDAAPAERTSDFGRYALVIEVDGAPHDFLYTVERPASGGRAVLWEPAHSILSDPAVPFLVVAAISDIVEGFHHGQAVPLPLIVEPLEPGPNTLVIDL